LIEKIRPKKVSCLRSKFKWEKPDKEFQIESFSEQSSIRQYKRNGVTPMDAVTASQHIGTEAHRFEIAA